MMSTTPFYTAAILVKDDPRSTPITDVLSSCEFLLFNVVILFIMDSLYTLFFYIIKIILEYTRLFENSIIINALLKIVLKSIQRFYES